MTEPVQIYFEMSPDREDSPYTVVRNPRILPAALSSQIARYGLKIDPHDKTSLSGRLKGNKDALITLIQTYGLAVEILPSA